MSEVSWSEAAAVFEAAIALPPGERDAFLVGACASNPLLLARVRAMLDADAAAPSLFGASPAQLAEAVVAGAARQLEGRRVGPYVILRELGRGGMGVVYLAQREDVGLRAAVKLITSGLAFPANLARFEAERRVLARLDHPNVARLLDAGVADDEAPWFAMEYVDGLPIDEYCDAHHLTVRERLVLFEKVGEAVAYAHRNLVVHRDLKPSNILVTATGEPKLVDFGIAKLLAPDDERSAHTTVGAPPLTLAYASPEQVRGEPVTTATDVYQLGILLHELLTGRRACGSTRRALHPLSPGADLEAARPSSLVTITSADEAPPVVAGRSADELAVLRRTTPARLRRELSGDLDLIVRMALQPEPSRRYTSAGQLVHDVRAHRQGRPIVAGPNSIRDRVTRLVARHRTVTALAAVIVVMLVGSSILFALQNHRLVRERDRARQITALVEELLRRADPTAVGTDTLTARAALDEATRQARAELHEDPVAWGRLLLVIGRVHRNRGRLDEAATVLDTALAALRASAPPSDSTLLAALSLLGGVHVERGQVDRGIALLEEALRSARSLGPARREELATQLVDLGFGRQVAGDHARAERLYGEALPILRTLPDSGGNDYDRATLNSGFIAQGRGELAVAESLFRQVLRRRVLRLGATASSTLNAAHSLASVLLELGRVDEAMRHSAMVLATRRASLAPPHRDLALALELHGRALGAAGRHEEGLRMSREALDMTVALYGRRHLQVAWAAAGLARVTEQAGDLARARERYADAFALYRAAAGPRHPATLVAETNLAHAEFRLGRLEAALALYREAVPKLDSIWSGRPALRRPFGNFALVLGALGRCDEARAWQERATALGRRDVLSMRPVETGSAAGRAPGSGFPPTRCT